MNRHDPQTRLQHDLLHLEEDTPPQDTTQTPDFTASDETKLRALLTRGEQLAQQQPSLPDALWDGPRLQVLEGGQAERPRSNTASRRLYPLLAVAACAVLFLSVPTDWLTQPSTSSNKPLTGRSALRPKGASMTTRAHHTPSFSFSFFYRRGGVSQKGAANTLVQADDQLRFTARYRTKQRAYLQLFMSDQRGQLSPLYPDASGRAFPLRAAPESKTLVLPDGAILDDAKEAERIYVCITRRPLSYRTFQRTLREQLRERSIQSLKTLPMSRCIHQQSWLLTKRQHTPQHKENK